MAESAMSWSSAPRIAWYGDDFTGASDTLATLAEGGQRALLFLGVPSAARLARCGPLDAVGIAGAARSMAVDAMRVDLAPVARFFASLRVALVQYKCCSTFDSAPAVGNLAVAIDTLCEPFGETFVGVVGGQPSLGRYCVFGQLFASAGGPEVFRIDRHPTMHRHPVTPMLEADLRVHLREQGMGDLALVDYRQYTADTADAAAALPGPRVLFDVTEAAQLPVIGRLLWQQATRVPGRPAVVLGASSVSEALLAHWREQPDDRAGAPAAVRAPDVAPAAGPVLVLCGSQSPVTARQVAASGDLFVPLSFDPGRDASDVLAAAAACLRDGRHLLLRTTAPAPGGASPRQAAEASAALLARLLHDVPAIRRVGIAGGDTSSLAVQALDVWALEYAGRLAPGVSLVRARSDVARFDGLELMLKGGQMGGDALFARLLG